MSQTVGRRPTRQLLCEQYIRRINNSGMYYERGAELGDADARKDANKTEVALLNGGGHANGALGMQNEQRILICIQLVIVAA